MLDSLANTTLFAILEHIRLNFTHFLTLARHKQMALAEKAIDVLVRKTLISLASLGPLSANVTASIAITHEVSLFSVPVQCPCSAS